MAAVIKLPKPHAGQQRMLGEARRFNVACCGRRFGKTLFGIDLLIARGRHCAARGLPVAWFAPKYRLLEEVWDTTKKALEQVTRRANASSHVIELTTGGRIDFWTLEDENPARGRKYARVVVDEAAMVPGLLKRWNEAIRPTLTDFRGDAWFFSTPKGLNDFATLHKRGFREGGAEHPDLDPQWQSWTMPTSGNPHIDAGEIEAARKELPDLVFRQEYGAQFVHLGAGLVKPEMLRIGPPPSGLPVVLGVDLALSQKQGADWTAIAALSRDPDSGRLYLREIERHRCAFHEVLGAIKAAAARHHPSIIVVEKAQYQAAAVQELTRTTSLPVRGIAPDKDKVTRFLPVLSRYEQGVVYHDPSGVPAWFREEVLSFPEGGHDDGVDALAYAFMALDMLRPSIHAIKVPGL